MTPTYQSNLNAAIRDVVIRLTAGEIASAWEGLRTLFALLPPECNRECRADFDKVKRKLQDINSTRGIDYYDTMLRRSIGTKAYLCDACYLLFEKMKDSLHHKGYLESGGAKPRNQQVANI